MTFLTANPHNSYSLPGHVVASFLMLPILLLFRTFSMYYRLVNT